MIFLTLGIYLRSIKIILSSLKKDEIVIDLEHKNIVKLLDIIISKPTSLNKMRGNVYLLLE